jgi:hypothetical protein
MPSIENLLDQLEETKLRFDPRSRARMEKLLTLLGRKKFSDIESLIRFHEALLFLRAHPHSPEVFRLAEELLSSFFARVELIRANGADMTPFDYIEYSGITGTVLSGTFSYGLARWLVGRYPSQTSINWERYENKGRLAAALPRLLPLFTEDSLVEANIPHREWLRAAMGRENNDLKWLIKRLERLPISEREKINLYDSLELPVRWEIGETPAARTHNRTTPREVFYHTGPLIQRREVSLRAALDEPSAPIQKLSVREGEAALDNLKETTAVRYRELYGITYGDPRSVVKAEMGRGVEMFLWGLAPERRLPLRAYHAGFTLKNGVPINYIEGITICERMEVGFNTFYTYRQGESAWVYARALKLLNQVVGATCFSLDPYQIGHHNDEAIESGAFWFYRKLGFRSTRKELAKMAEKEEKKIASFPGYRTSARALRRLALAPVVYEHNAAARGEWDSFQIRNIGLAVDRRMAERFDGDASRMRAAAMSEVALALEIDQSALNTCEQTAFENLALVLALMPDLDRWTSEEKRDAAGVIRAKAARDESRYARLLQKHARLRREIIRLGSSGSAD